MNIAKSWDNQQVIEVSDANRRPIESSSCDAMERTQTVLWISADWGYFSDFMYWAPLLAGYAKVFPNTKILCMPKMQTKNVFKLPLDATVKIYRFVLRRASQMNPYAKVLDLPHPSLILKIIKHKPDLLILNDFSRVTQVGALAACFVQNCRILLLVEADPKYRGVEHKGIQLQLRKFVAKRADAIIINQEECSGYLTNTLGVDPRRIITRPYLTSQPGNVRSLADLPASTVDDEKVNFLFLNTLSRRKGIDLLVRAVAEVDPGQRARMRVRIVGDGPERAEVEALTDELQLRDTIEFVGRVPYDKINEYYEAADVVAVPTILEYGGMTTFEALSFGLPMILSIHSGYLSEVLVEGENGFAIDPTDATAFAAKLSWFVDHRDRLPAMRQKSIEVNKRFSIESVVENLTYASERALAPR